MKRRKVGKSYCRQKAGNTVKTEGTSQFNNATPRSLRHGLVARGERLQIYALFAAAIRTGQSRLPAFDTAVDLHRFIDMIKQSIRSSRRRIQGGGFRSPEAWPPPGDTRRSLGPRSPWGGIDDDAQQRWLNGGDGVGPYQAHYTPLLSPGASVGQSCVRAARWDAGGRHSALS